MSGPSKVQEVSFFAERGYKASREFLSRRLPFPAKLDAASFEHLRTLGGYLFERGDRRFADWIHRVYQDFGPSARPHLMSVWMAIPRRILEIFESSTSAGITSVERSQLMLASDELAKAWRAAEIGRAKPGGMMHDHYCSDCGSECSEDFEDCVLGTRTQCEECRNKELYGHQHLCPQCRRSRSCTSRACMDESSAVCGDCFTPQGEIATRHRGISRRFLL
jgi:hypothetical protein